MNVSVLPFEGFGGAQEARWHGPADAACVVAVAPALGLRADYYELLAAALVEAGCAVVTFDLPGHGRSPLRASRHSDWGYVALIEHFAALRRAVRGRAPGARFVWLGHSIGGQVALMDGEHADAVVLVASGPPYFRAWPGAAAAALLVRTSLAAVVATVVGHFPGDRVGFAGREARTLIREWATVARTGRYRFDGLDGDAAIARAAIPILVVPVEGDDLAPPAAMEHTVAKATRARPSRGFFPLLEQDEKLRQNPHNRWPRSPAPVVREVRAFLGREGLLASRKEVSP